MYALSETSPAFDCLHFSKLELLLYIIPFGQLINRLHKETGMSSDWIGN